MPDVRRPDRSFRPMPDPLAKELLQPRSLTEAPPESLPCIEVKSPGWHAHLFRKRLGTFDPRARHGDLVRLKNREGKPLGLGYFNPRAEISVRILSRNVVPIDDSWWHARLTAALNYRHDFLALDEATNAYRLIHAEGDQVPGIVVDRYANLLVGEVFTLSMYQRSADIMSRLRDLTGAEFWYVRPGPNTLQQEGFEALPHGSPGCPRRVTVKECGVQYGVELTRGHKTGFFCDQRENRILLAQWARPESMLDLCCYTGGFSLAAACTERITDITGVDLDESAVALARKNAQRNRVKVRFVHADAFAYMRDMLRNGRQFQTVVLDPPKLIYGRNEKEAGRRKYYDFNRLALQLVAPGGLLLTCSCSGLLSMEEFQRTVCAAVSEGRHIQILHRSGAGADHPISGDCPELDYLKALWIRVT